MMKALYKVGLWIDDGWERGYAHHIVLASNEHRAIELAVKHWKDKDDTNIVIPEYVLKMDDFAEGVIS